MGNEGSLGEIGLSTSPLDGALGGVGAASNPGTKLDLHGGLGESSAALSIGILQLTNLGVVDKPDNVVLGPLDRVGVDLVLRVGDIVVGTSVVGGSITLTEVVGLHLCLVTTKPLPVDLVQVVGLQDEARNNAGARGGLELYIDSAEEDVLGAGNGGGLRLLVDGEDSAVGVVGKLSTIGNLEQITFSLGEIYSDAGSKSIVSRTS